MDVWVSLGVGIHRYLAQYRLSGLGDHRALLSPSVPYTPLLSRGGGQSDSQSQPLMLGPLGWEISMDFII